MSGFKRTSPWLNTNSLPYTVLGDAKDIHVGEGFSVSRPPLPFFDVTGSEIYFGNSVMMSSGVYIHTHSHEFSKRNWRDLPIIINNEPTLIGDYVFFGVNAQIMHTCKSIGDYSVIAAGAIVTKDVPDYEIWAGNPARKIDSVE